MSHPPETASISTSQNQKSSQVPFNGDFENDPNYELVRNNNYAVCWITTLSGLILGILGMTLSFMSLGNPETNFMFTFGISAAACGLGLFMLLLVIIPSYGAGRPSPLKILPLALGILVYIGCMIKSYLDKNMGWIDLAIRAGISVALCAFLYFEHLDYDDGGSFLLNCKPWIYKLKQKPKESV